MVKRDVNYTLTPLRSSIVMACGRTVTVDVKRSERDEDGILPLECYVNFDVFSFQFPLCI